MAILDHITFSGVQYDIADSTARESLGQKADITAVSSAISAAIDGLASEEWVESQGFLTEHQSLSAYSTTEEMNAAINASVSGKADASDLSSKQDVLESGENIKTVNGESILGAGNILIEQGTVDSELDENSSNAIANSAVTTALNGKADVSSIEDMATKTWVGEQGFLTEHQSLSAYSTTAEMNAAIDAATSGKANADDVYSKSDTYSSNEIDTALSEKADASSTYSKDDADAAINAATSGKADTSAVTAAIDAATSGKANADDVYVKNNTSSSTEISAALELKADVSSTTNYIDGVEYVVSGSEHTIKFYHGENEIDSINANDFIKDGMVDSVQIVNDNLVITFNTDSGKDAISIPLTDIFNPSNYYDKAAMDEILSGKTDNSDFDEYKSSNNANIEYISGQVDTKLSESAFNQARQEIENEISSGASDISSLSEALSALSQTVEYLEDNKVDVDTFEDVVGSGFTDETITDVITDNEKVVAIALTDLNTRLNGHTSNANIHVTAADKARWDAGMETSAFTAHTADTTIHVTAAEKSTWNDKVSTSDLLEVIGTGFTQTNVTDVIVSNELVVAAALTDLDERIRELEERVRELEEMLH